MSWRFALTPKWIVRHVLVAVAVVAMILLGLWQLRRLDERRDHNALVEARQAEPVADVLDVVPTGVDPGDPAVEEVLYRNVEATGTYEDADTVVVENRTYEGVSGAWVLTPLRLADGSAVVVNRGFVGFDRDGEIAPPPAPAGTVRVEGLVLGTQERGRFGARDPDEGRVERLARVDLARYAAQLDYDLLPAYVQRTESDPPEADGDAERPALVPVPAPELGEGPHLGYAVQWFIFTTIAAVGYTLLLRKVAAEQGKLAEAT